MRLASTLAVLAVAFFLAGCEKEAPRPAPAPQPVPQQQAPWQFVMGRPPRDLSQDGDEVSFSFDSAEPHMLLRKTGPLSGSVKVVWKYEGGSVKPIQGSTATVSLIIVRAGNDWQAKDANERFYHAGQPIMAAGGVMDVPLHFERWTNVYGQPSASGFADAIARAEYVGLAFGDPAAGATAHGVNGAGRFSFAFSVE